MDKNFIYLDNAATTPLLDGVKAHIIKNLDTFGNPSSLHNLGFESEKHLNYTRKILLSNLGVTPKKQNFIFTSGATEANNLALFGVMQAKERNFGKKIIISASEHASIISTAKKLSALGYKVVEIPSPKGKLDIDALIDAVDQNTVMVSVMAINNETGAKNPISDIALAAKSKNPDIIVHADCVQAFAKEIISPEKMGIDMLSLSGHKIGALKGIGGLYVSDAVIKAKAVSPIIYGGNQENTMRGGTENLLGVISLGKAVEIWNENREKFSEKLKNLSEYFIENISKVPNITLNLPNSRAWHIVNITLPKIKSETMLNFLSEQNIFVSSGSACSSHNRSVSHVLRDFGLSENAADSSIRISFGIQNTTEDIDVFISALEKGVKVLAKMR